MSDKKKRLLEKLLEVSNITAIYRTRETFDMYLTCLGLDYSSTHAEHKIYKYLTKREKVIKRGKRFFSKIIFIMTHCFIRYSRCGICLTKYKVTK